MKTEYYIAAIITVLFLGSIYAKDRSEQISKKSQEREERYQSYVFNQVVDENQKVHQNKICINHYDITICKQQDPELTTAFNELSPFIHSFVEKRERIFNSEAISIEVFQNHMIVKSELSPFAVRFFLTKIGSEIDESRLSKVEDGKTYYYASLPNLYYNNYLNGLDLRIGNNRFYLSSGDKENISSLEAYGDVFYDDKHRRYIVEF